MTKRYRSNLRLDNFTRARRNFCAALARCQRNPTARNLAAVEQADRLYWRAKSAVDQLKQHRARNSAERDRAPVSHAGHVTGQP